MRRRFTVAFSIYLLIIASSFSVSRVSSLSTASSTYRTRNVFLVVMDGVRYSETFGDPAHRFIPHLWNDLRPLGAIYTNFRNNAITVTVPGHTAMLTGVWQNVKNDGSERPHQPTVFEYYRKETGAPANKTWVVVQHMNLISTDYSDDPEYGKQYGANLDSPGLHKRGELEHTGDVATWDILKSVMNRDHPSLVMVNFGMTDSMGHSGSWAGYANAILDADTLIYYLWLKIQSDPVYKDKTTMFVTNDHGRHLDGVKTGFQDHGDDCEGCRHVMMLVTGPDTKSNVVVDTARQLIAVAPTIGALMRFSTPLAKGNVMSDMLAGNTQEPLSKTLSSEIILLVAAITLLGSLLFIFMFAERKRKHIARAKLQCESGSPGVIVTQKSYTERIPESEKFN